MINFQDLGLRGLIAVANVSLFTLRFTIFIRELIDLDCRMIVLSIYNRVNSLVGRHSHFLVCTTRQDLSGTMFVSSYGNYGVESGSSIQSFKNLCKTRATMITMVGIAGLRTYAIA